MSFGYLTAQNMKYGLRNSPYLAGAGLIGFGSYKGFEHSQDQDGDIDKAAATAGSVALYGTAIGMPAIGMAKHIISKKASAIGSSITSHANENAAWQMGSSARKGIDSGLDAVSSLNKAKVKSMITAAKPSALKYLPIGGGAALGAYIGSQSGDSKDKTRNTIIGGAVGAGGGAAFKGAQHLLHAVEHVPGPLKVAGVIAATAGVAGAYELSRSDNETTGVAGYDTTGQVQQASVKQRLNMINAKGDSVIGLHNSR